MSRRRKSRCCIFTFTNRSGHGSNARRISLELFHITVTMRFSAKSSAISTSDFLTQQNTVFAFRRQGRHILSPCACRNGKVGSLSTLSSDLDMIYICACQHACVCMYVGLHATDTYAFCVRPVIALASLLAGGMIAYGLHEVEGVQACQTQNARNAVTRLDGASQGSSFALQQHEAKTVAGFRIRARAEMWGNMGYWSWHLATDLSTRA